MTPRPQALSRASSFEEVVAAHRAYLHSLQSTCFLLLDRTWRLLDAAVQSLLNLVLAYCQLQRAKMDPIQVGTCAARAWENMYILPLRNTYVHKSSTAYAATHDAAGGGAALDDWAGV